MGGPKPLCWGPPGCLGDPSDLDKVQVGFTTVIPILSLTSAQVVSCTARGYGLPWSCKNPRTWRGRVAKLGGWQQPRGVLLQEGLGL